MRAERAALVAFGVVAILGVAGSAAWLLDVPRPWIADNGGVTSSAAAGVSDRDSTDGGPASAPARVSTSGQDDGSGLDHAPEGSNQASAPEQDSAEAIQGVLRHARAGVAGVTFNVTRVDGSMVGTTVTGVDGRWRIAVPGPGDYVVTLDVSTLPEGVPPPTHASITTTVNDEQDRSVGFRLGARDQG